MKNQKLYKSKFLLSVYDDEDLCAGVFHTAAELAEFIEYPEKITRNIIRQFETGERKTLRLNKRNYTLHLVKSED